MFELLESVLGALLAVPSLILNTLASLIPI